MPLGLPQSEEGKERPFEWLGDLGDEIVGGFMGLMMSGISLLNVHLYEDVNNGIDCPSELGAS